MTGPTFQEARARIAGRIKSHIELTDRQMWMWTDQAEKAERQAKILAQEWISFPFADVRAIVEGFDTQVEQAALKRARSLQSWMKDAITFFDRCSADIADHIDNGAVEEAGRLMMRGYALFGLGDDACLAVLLHSDLPLPGEPPRRFCKHHPDREAVTDLNGDNLCQGCANDWVRAEGAYQQYLEDEGQA